MQAGNAAYAAPSRLPRRRPSRLPPTAVFRRRVAAATLLQRERMLPVLQRCAAAPRHGTVWAGLNDDGASARHAGPVPCLRTRQRGRRGVRRARKGRLALARCSGSPPPPSLPLPLPSSLPPSLPSSLPPSLPTHPSALDVTLFQDVDKREGGAPAGQRGSGDERERALLPAVVAPCGARACAGGRAEEEGCARWAAGHGKPSPFVSWAGQALRDHLPP